MQICSIQTSHLIFKVHFNIILLSTNSPFNLGLFFWFLHQNPLNTFLLSHMYHISNHFCHGQFDHPKYIWRGIQIRNLVTGQRTATKLQCCTFESCCLKKFQTWITHVSKYVKVELKSNSVSVQITSPLPLGLYH